MRKSKLQGFTLIEVLLFLVVFIIIIGVTITNTQQKTDVTRRQRAILQMQQILNAGMIYYVEHGTWPASLATLTTAAAGNLIPTTLTTNPWGNSYTIFSFNGNEPGSHTSGSTQEPGAFFVYSNIPQYSSATIVAGSVPGGYYTETAAALPMAPPASAQNGGGTLCVATDTTCYVVGQVTIPGQDLNNARAINFSGIYSSGACVPVPQCPIAPDGTTQLVPQIFVIPVQIRGVYGDPGCTLTGTGQYNCAAAYTEARLTGFSARAVGGNRIDPPSCIDNATYASCHGSVTSTGSYGSLAGTVNNFYWRVCLTTNTDQGTVNPLTPSTSYTASPTAGQVAWGQFMGTVLAITRCATPEEAAQSSYGSPTGTTFSGSTMQVWSP